jgi:hypothetical protein
VPKTLSGSVLALVRSLHCILVCLLRGSSCSWWARDQFHLLFNVCVMSLICGTALTIHFASLSIFTRVPQQHCLFSPAHAHHIRESHEEAEDGAPATKGEPPRRRRPPTRCYVVPADSGLGKELRVTATMFRSQLSERRVVRHLGIFSEVLWRARS